MVGLLQGFIDTDGHPLRHAGPLQGKFTFRHIGPVVRRIPGPFFREDNATLPFDLGIKQQCAPGIIGHDQEALFQLLAIAARQNNIIDRLVETRTGIGIATETHADRLEIFDQLSGFEVGRAVEQHMLEEMGIASLLLGFVQRSGLDVEIDGDPVLRLLIFLQDIAKPVRQGPHDQTGIGFEIAPRRWPVGGDTGIGLLASRRLTGVGRQNPGRNKHQGKDSALKISVKFHICTILH